MLKQILDSYAHAKIKVEIQAKKVKNINFRIKSINEPPFTSLLMVSYLTRMSQNLLAQSLQNRLSWAIDCQQKLQAKQQKQKKSLYFNDIKDLQNLTPDSEIYFVGQKTTVQDLFAQTFQKTDFSNIDIARTLINIFKF